VHFVAAYDLALELISQADAQIDAKPLRAFIADYQTRSALKPGEFSAILIMLPPEVPVMHLLCTSGSDGCPICS